MTILIIIYRRFRVNIFNKCIKRSSKTTVKPFSATILYFLLHLYGRQVKKLSLHRTLHSSLQKRFKFSIKFFRLKKRITYRKNYRKLKLSLNVPLNDVRY